MSENKFAVINLKKMKNNDLAKIAEHCRRTALDGEYSNPNIDPERTHLNIRRSDFSENEKLKDLIDRRIAERENQKKKVRKDAVKMISAVISASPEYMNSLNREEQIRYFDEALRFCQKRFGKENCIEMSVHFDETTPHAHIAIVPIIQGKLCAKEIVTRRFLFELQEEFPQAMRERGFDVKRGEGGDPRERRKHLSEEEYRLKMKEKDLKGKEEGLKKFEQRLEDSFEALELPRQALQDACNAPQLHLEVSEPLFSDKKVKVNKEELAEILTRAELSEKLLAKIGADQLKANRREAELNKIKEELKKQQELAENQAKRLREIGNEYRIILRENAEIRDHNAELQTENSFMKEFIAGRGLTEDFEDWAHALKEAQADLADQPVLSGF